MRFFSLLLFTCMASCSATQFTSDIPNLGQSTWKLTSIEQKPVNFGDRAFLNFDEKENKISGKAACNSFSAEYEMIGQKITFPSIASTKMYCEGIMDDENRIITALQKVARYEVKANMLYLYSSAGLVLTYKR